MAEQKKLSPEALAKLTKEITAQVLNEVDRVATEKGISPDEAAKGISIRSRIDIAYNCTGSEFGCNIKYDCSGTDNCTNKFTCGAYRETV